MIKKRLYTVARIAMVAVVAAVLLTPLSASAATSSDVREAQTIMTKFGIPTGKIDGDYGPNTARGLCAVRQMAGWSPNRNNVDGPLMSKLRTWNKYSSLRQIKAPTLAGKSTYLLVLQKCQAILYVQNGVYHRVMAASTGTNAAQSDDGESHKTPNGSWYLGYTSRTDGHPTGWSCSTLYPESCRRHPGVGVNSKYSDYGNMYNKRSIVGDVLLHGSTSVPPRPASHGCVRVTIADSDWMFRNVGNDAKPYIKIVGSY